MGDILYGLLGGTFKSKDREVAEEEEEEEEKGEEEEDEEEGEGRKKDFQ